MISSLNPFILTQADTFDYNIKLQNILQSIGFEAGGGTIYIFIPVLIFILFFLFMIRCGFKSPGQFVRTKVKTEKQTLS